LPVTIERAAVDSADALRLFRELWAEVDRLYGNELPSGSTLAGMESPRATFVIAREDDTAIGCGALQPLRDHIAEVKRLYVAPDHRGRGIARQIMHALEQHALEHSFSAIWLETGLRQPGAIRLYESLGYTRIAGFGDYKDDPLSVCYGKQLN
jgi:GNAT superfamily N-acetyltransferase